MNSASASPFRYRNVGGFGVFGFVVGWFLCVLFFFFLSLCLREIVFCGTVLLLLSKLYFQIKALAHIQK